MYAERTESISNIRRDLMNDINDDSDAFLNENDVDDDRDEYEDELTSDKNAHPYPIPTYDDSSEDSDIGNEKNSIGEDDDQTQSEADSQAQDEAVGHASFHPSLAQDIPPSAPESKAFLNPCDSHEHSTNDGR